MKYPFRIGIYDVGIRSVEVWFDPKLGGASYEIGIKAISKITVGLRSSHNWATTVSDLLHEIMELNTTDLGVRFVPALDYAMASDGFAFHFNHDQFSQIVARSGHFFADVYEDLKRVYDSYAKARRRKLH